MLDRNTQGTLGQVTALVETILRGNGHPVSVGSDDRLVDAGLTSMDMVNLMLAVEAAFDIMIPPADITPANFRSVSTIEAMVERILADGSN